jgi:demethylmenaquinone methyltransferase/2-methoxy-6-polyprenyl-1,4-benzoquinol methylase
MSESDSGRDVNAWKDIVRAVERSAPVYECISEVISLGLAKPVRRRAISRLERNRNDWVLDSGSGPGTSTRLLARRGFRKIVAIDPSIRLLRSAKLQFPNDFELVQAIAEHLPFRAEGFASIVTCFSLRDVRDVESTLGEFRRVMKLHGTLEIVDIGKPDNLFFRRVTENYVSLVMPVITKWLIRGRIQGNPFRMIVPTFHRLLPNHQLSALVENVVGSSLLEQFLFGGLIIIEGRPTGNKNRKLESK